MRRDTYRAPADCLLGGPQGENDLATWNRLFNVRANVACLRYMLKDSGSMLYQRPRMPAPFYGITPESQYEDYERQLARYREQQDAHEALKIWVERTVCTHLYKTACLPHWTVFQWRSRIEELVIRLETNKVDKAKQPGG